MSFYFKVNVMIFRKNNKDFIVDIPVYNIVPNPSQPRQSFDYDSLYGLAESIKSNGIIQPLLVRAVSDSEYELISGERRLRAARIAGLSSVPCIIRNINSNDSAVFAVLENLQRKDLNFFEEALSINRLSSEFGFTQSQIGKRLGKSQSSLSNKIRLLKIPAPLREKIIDSNLTERHARALLKLNDPALMEKCLDYIINNSLNVFQTEKYIDSVLFKPQSSPPTKPRLKMLTDVRLFINSINQAVKTMNDAGIDANVKKTETTDSVQFVITIDKRRKYYKVV